MTKRRIQKTFKVTLTVSARSAEEAKREIGAIQYDYEDATEPSWDPDGFSIVSIDKVVEQKGPSPFCWELDRLEGKEL